MMFSNGSVDRFQRIETGGTLTIRRKPRVKRIAVRAVCFDADAKPFSK